MKGTAEGGAPVGESGILRQSQRVLMSHFFKVKMPLFLHSNITKLRKKDKKLGISDQIFMFMKLW